METIKIRPTPGMWNVELNQSDNQGARWVIDNSSLIESGVSVGVEHIVNLTVRRLVEMSGKVYWDLDDDELPGFGEGLANVSVNISSIDNTSHSLTTDDGGNWAIYLPAGSSWNISVEKPGFANESVFVTLGAIGQIENIEITAGSVEVSGTISYISNEWIFDDDWDIVLIPTHGISRERVVPEKVGNEVDGWTGEWVASVEPGRWIVYATVDSPEEGLYLVAVDLLDADTDGGSVDSDLSIGGKLFLDTEWLDYEGESHSLLEIDDYDLVISVGMGVEWSEELDGDGILEMLLPTGRIDASSDFEIEQRSRNMSYSGGQGVTMRAGQDSPLKTLSLERASNQDIEISAIGESAVTLELDPDCEAEPDCEYLPVEFILHINYSGHNPYDTYDVAGTVLGTDGGLWLVQFENASGGWNSTASFEMGLDNTETIDNFVVRVSPANKSQAHHFQLGHTILIKLSTAEGYSIDHSLSVVVPKLSGFDVTEDYVDTVYFSSGEKLLNVEIPYQNLGNSDDLLTFDYQSTEHWNVGMPTMQPISPFSEGITTMSLSYAVEGEEGPLPEYTIEFTVRDSDNNSYDYHITLLRDSPAISIRGNTIQLQGGGNPIAGQKPVYVVEVVNEAHVSAEDVTLRARLCNDIRCESTAGVNSTVVSDVPEQGSSLFYVPMDFSNFTTNKYFIIFEIVPPGFNEGDDLESCSEQVDEVLVCVMEAQLWPEAEEEVLGWITYLLLLMLALALWSLTRRTGRRPGAPF